MKYALVNNERQEARPGLDGRCPSCDDSTIAKCGKIKIHHWAHKGKLMCDPWWENETEWHRKWKGHFPKEWQEVIHFDENSERHIADVKTDHGLVIEFQHSAIKTEERHSREFFYKNMIWFVDGTRRKNDKNCFISHVESSGIIDVSREERILIRFGKCPLLRDWWESTFPVFFDLGENRLWVLISKTSKKYLFAVDRDKLISSLLHNSQLKDFTELSKHWNNRIAFHEWHLNWHPGRAGRQIRR